jgi:hypothetical protein
MISSLLLTDDEVIALAAVVGRPWPIGLATVASTAEALREAGVRGVRSLAVRGLLAANPTSEPTHVIHPELEALVVGFLAAPSHVGAYLAPADEPDRLAGASITAARSDSDWLMVSTTAQGVHGIRPASQTEVLDAVAELAEKTHDGTLLSGSTDAAAYSCVIRWGDGEDQRLVVAGRGSDGLPWHRAAVVESFATALQSSNSS